MAWRNHCYNDVLPFTAMIAAECATVGLNTLFKAAVADGLSYYVFIVYTYAIAGLLLLPLPFIFRSKVATPAPHRNYKLSLGLRLICLSLLGVTAQICAYTGLEYSSPTLSSAISNLTPAYTFILAVALRMEKLALRSLSTQAKIVGTVVSISGALVVLLYKGIPLILSLTLSNHDYYLSSSQTSNWIIGGLLFAAQYLLTSTWYIVQTQVIKIYPNELLMVLMYYICTTIVAIPVCLIAESNFNVWILTTRREVVTIVYSGIFGQAIVTIIHTWGLNLKGPVYITMFRPVSIAIAAAMGVLFLGDTLYIGSVVGALIICTGFYAVMWGKAKEYEMSKEGGDGSRSKTPLLQKH